LYFFFLKIKIKLLAILSKIGLSLVLPEIRYFLWVFIF